MSGFFIGMIPTFVLVAFVWAAVPFVGRFGSFVSGKDYGVALLYVQGALFAYVGVALTTAFFAGRYAHLMLRAFGVR